jgi:hypothetical protein
MHLGSDKWGVESLDYPLILVTCQSRSKARHQSGATQGFASSIEPQSRAPKRSRTRCRLAKLPRRFARADRAVAHLADIHALPPRGLPTDGDVNTHCSRPFILHGIYPAGNAIVDANQQRGINSDPTTPRITVTRHRQDQRHECHQPLFSRHLPATSTLEHPKRCQLLIVIEIAAPTESCLESIVGHAAHRFHVAHQNGGARFT